MNEVLIGVIIFAAGIAIGSLLGTFNTDVSWRLDCQTIGVHRYLDKGYDCKERK